MLKLDHDLNEKDIRNTIICIDTDNEQGANERILENLKSVNCKAIKVELTN